MRLVKTCDAFPEQYDVFDGDTKVGYLRLRWGSFTASTGSSLTDKMLYCADIGDDGIAGAFQSDEQRAFHLNAAIEAIKSELHKPHYP